MNTIQSKEDLQNFVDLCRTFHQESRVANIEFDVRTVCNTLNTALGNPETFFVKFFRNSENIIVGIFIGAIQPLFFSTKTQAQDLVFYVLPEYRGGTWFVKTLREFEKWSYESGASLISILHNTGINMDKIGGMMDKFNYKQTGYCFTKEI